MGKGRYPNLSCLQQGFTSFYFYQQPVPYISRKAMVISSPEPFSYSINRFNGIQVCATVVSNSGIWRVPGWDSRLNV